jgi:hypothetical protein
MNSRIVGQERKNSFNQTQEKVRVSNRKTEAVVFDGASGDVPKLNAGLRNDANFIAAISQISDGLPDNLMLRILLDGEPQRKICVGEMNHKWSS